MHVIQYFPDAVTGFMVSMSNLGSGEKSDKQAFSNMRMGEGD